MKRLQTFDAVIVALGGMKKTAALLKRGMPQLCYWRKTYRRFPARHYRTIRDELAKRDCAAIDDVFEFEQRADAA